jgi:hypothetical protein
MSADFDIGFDRSPDSWNCTRGMLHWVETTVADHSQDPAVAAKLRELADSGYQFLNFTTASTEDSSGRAEKPGYRQCRA